MNYDRDLLFATYNARPAHMQVRADMLDAAGQDFDRQKHSMLALEGALVRWLVEHRHVLGDQFCTHALLLRLPLAEAEEGDHAAARMRARIAYSRVLRPACLRALSARWAELGHLTAAEEQISVRLHSRAFALASDAGWDLPAIDAARAALDRILQDARPVQVATSPQLAHRIAI